MVESKQALKATKKAATLLQRKNLKKLEEHALKVGQQFRTLLHMKKLEKKNKSWNSVIKGQNQHSFHD